MNGTAAVFAVVLAGCSSASGQARLSQLETQAQEDDEIIVGLSERVAAFERTVDELVDLYQQASDTLEAAEHKYELARRSGDASSQAFQRAASDYEVASRRWRLVTITLLAAANWDYAGHLCHTRMTTAAYRKKLRKEGIDLDGLDADHGLPKSRGGADHPLNYRMIDSSLNRSLGNDVMRKLMEHPLHILRGTAVSALMRLRCSPRL
ncbi:hypothetical protein [Enhygromyxa salina]|nr:hypothetical protein [Enhygromyxa salina]